MKRSGLEDVCVPPNEVIRGSRKFEEGTRTGREETRVLAAADREVGQRHTHSP